MYWLKHEAHVMACKIYLLDLSKLPPAVTNGPRPTAECQLLAGMGLILEACEVEWPKNMSVSMMYI